MPHFIHLHCHTEYSLVDSLISLKPFVKTVRERGMPACAVTDQSNLFALVKFYRAAQSEGIKPIIGVDVRLSDGPDMTSRLVLLCQNDTGYRNLTRLVSKSYTKGQLKGIPHLQRDWLKGATDGLLAISGGREGDIGQALLAGHPDLVRQRLAGWQALFPQRFYLELQRTGRANEEEYLHAAVELALATDTPVVATNDVCFLDPEDFQAHEVRVCIHEGYTLTDSRRPHHYSPQQYLRSPQEMAELFADLPEAIENTWLIAQRCNLELTLGKNFLPDFPIPQGQTVAEYFSQQARLGLEQRLATFFDNTRPEFAEQRRPYDERLTRELGVILQMGFPGYFLIVADFIQWAKDNNIPVGPGRGSGAGSLVAYALRITDLDPLKYELLFERFLNPERVSMPDFDIDFCMEGRDAVIDYVAKRYGRDRVSQIITYGSMAAKAVVRDVGRVLGHPHGFVDKIAKLIPFEVGITLDKALEAEPELRSRYQQEEEVRMLIDMAKKLEGLTRNPGKHAGGVVIAPTLLTDFTPLYCEQDSTDLITQFDKDDVEAIGLVKFDFLGLRTLTIIKWALATINRLQEEPLDILKIPLTDKNTFDLLRRGDTTAVFQLESSGIKKLIRRLLPDRFEDLVALVALYRPGPLQSGMVDDFIDRKHGKARIEYPHPDLAPILKPTYGVIVYQEQVMQITQVLAGYTLGGADLLRRAIGKKKPEEMAKQRATFVEGAKERGVKEETATYIFDLMEKFAEYGFNRTLIKGTEIYTLEGIKKIEDCQVGNEVVTLTRTGDYTYSKIVQRHDHGQVPMWEITFFDGTVEKCTLDHKWLTQYGQLPLWAIIQMGESVWGTSTYQTHHIRPLETGFHQSLFSKFSGEDSIENTTMKLKVGDSNFQTFLVINPSLDGEFQQQLWHTYLHQAGPMVREEQRWQFGQDMVLRKPIQAIFLGWCPGYDLEIDHPAHNFLLASGLCCSNSHSAAYALVSYQTAWLKTHYPAPFMAAVLSADMDKTEKVVHIIDECRAMNLKILPPDVNVCDYLFTVDEDQSYTIRYGLGAIKGVGEAAVENLLTERNQRGLFLDLFDFCRRIDLRKANRRVLEALISAGGLDKLGPNRATLMASIDSAIKVAEKHSTDRATGQNDIFAMSPSKRAVNRPPEEPKPFIKVANDWSLTEKLQGEKDVLGIYLSGHPINQHLPELAQLSLTPLAKVRATEYKQTLRVGGWVIDCRATYAKGKRMAFFTVEDDKGRLEVKVPPELYEQKQTLLTKDTLLIVEGEVREDDYNEGYTMTANQIVTLDQARDNQARRLEMTVAANLSQNGLAQRLIDILTPYRQAGRCRVLIYYQHPEALVELLLGENWRVQPHQTLIQQLQEMLGGEEKVKVVY